LYRPFDPIECARSTAEPVRTVPDNYIARKPPPVFARRTHPLRRTFQFTPPSALWFNAVENFFSKMTRQRTRWNVFRSLVDLQAGIKRYRAHPKPFGWTAPLPSPTKPPVCLLLLHGGSSLLFLGSTEGMVVQPLTGNGGYQE
jgi:hypothetical protein